ncbi:hypothetical protein B0H15DRAFT_978700, partial [Mycena belliarum]
HFPPTRHLGAVLFPGTCGTVPPSPSLGFRPVPMPAAAPRALAVDFDHRRATSAFPASFPESGPDLLLFINHDRDLAQRPFQMTYFLGAHQGCLYDSFALPSGSAINSRHYAFPTATTDLPVRSQDTVTMLDLNRFALHSLTSVPLDAVTMLERLQLKSQFVLEGRSYAYYDSTDPKRPPLPCLNEYKASADNLKTLLLCLINSSARTRAVTILYFTYLD